ncbi:putative metal chaperone YciC [Novipirellula aureliae]|uniref:Putative metal chaperone YciC n=1 Tax=Novipirellula aureliae TaxID=2527966 RepID=A0A5C6EE27_9BACT|nr:GTP-binding protein [Novipirellula aureliae]TWU45981.1 putative metal chaperone YciC [Novipirellula aureliae]
MLKSRYLMIGGFLGAGKTTSVVRLGKMIHQRQLSVGLITNDQSIGLVDTRHLRSEGFETEEITGGCFCCKFNSLVQASDKLSSADRPDVFIAEPVGSCTDLQATVSYPLQTMFGDQFVVAPYSVLLDPLRTRRVLKLDSGKTFSAKVLYIFEKQLEEAELLVINKCDRIDRERIDELESALRQRFPEKQILRVSARSGEGFEQWLSLLMETEATMTDSMELDYDEYAEGEALLGWLNLSAEIESSATTDGESIDGNKLVVQLATKIARRLEADQIEIAHLKMTLTPDSGNDLAVGNLVRTDGLFELSHELVEPLDAGELLINLRAEAAPERLRTIVEEDLQTQCRRSSIEFTINHAEAFQPGRPTPTYRMPEPK